MHRIDDGLAWKRRFEEPWHLLCENGSGPDGAMHLQMVGVAVAAGWVVADDDVRLLLVEDGADPSCDLEAIGVGESTWDLTLESGVRVVQRDEACDAECVGRGRELGGTVQRQVRRQAGGGESGRAIRGDDEHDAQPLGSGSGHGAGRQQCLIVRVGVDEHDGLATGVERRGRSRHPIIVAYGHGVRIAHVSDCYLPRTGGIETQVRALALAQAEAGHAIQILTATPGEMVRHGPDVVDGLSVERITVPLPADLPIHPRTRVQVATALRSNPVDVVHVHAGVISPFAWGAIRAARDLGVPCLVTVHSVWGPIAAPGFGLSDALLKWSAWGVQLSAVSEMAAERIARAVRGAGDVLVVPNGIDPSLWQVEPRPGAADDLRLVTVMRLAPRKRVVPLVRIVAMAQKSLLGAARLHLTIIGDGPERRLAEREVQRQGLDGVVAFAGRLGREQILDVFAQADLYVQPSVRESFGLAALEARTAGLPVLARSQTGTAQFIRDGVEGFLAASDRDMVRVILDAARDRPALERIAEHNRGTEPAQAWPNVLADVQSAYDVAASRVPAWRR